MPPQVVTDLAALAKCIADLDDLLRAISKSLPAANRSRALRDQIEATVVQAEILRLSVLMDRSSSEVVEAALTVKRSIGFANALAMRGRFGQGLQQAVLLALKLAEQVCRELSIMGDCVGP